MILRGLGLGNHPSLNTDATFQNFIVFYVLEGFFLNQSWLDCRSLVGLGCTETAHAGPSAGTSWFCITSCSQSEIKPHLGTFLPTALLGGKEPGAFLTTSDLPVSADTLGNLRLEDIAKAPSCA